MAHGPVGGKPPKTRAPKAWHQFAQAATVDLPKQLSATAAARRRLLRVRMR